MRFILRYIKLGIFSLSLAALFLSTAQAQNEQEERVEIIVLDKSTNEPIPAVDLNIRAIQVAGADMRSEEITDANGAFVIESDKQLQYLRIVAQKQGYVPVHLTWTAISANDYVRPRYTMTLESATSIGGFIHDQAGRAIEDANIYISLPGSFSGQSINITNHKEVTDANGFWRCDIVPSNLAGLSIRPEHPDYLSQQTPTPPLEDLRMLTAVMVLNKGLNITGRVMDVNNAPIEKALVSLGMNGQIINYPGIRTDSQGGFVFKDTSPEQLTLIVQASGYCPVSEQVTAEVNLPILEYRLQPGYTIKGRVVDTTGNPISDAVVAVNSWHGYNFSQWRAYTDAEGRFAWDEAPEDEVYFNIRKRGYTRINEYGLTTSAQEHLITMSQELRIYGGVFDAETNEPVSNFKLTPGIGSDSRSSVEWKHAGTTLFNNGRYEMTLTIPGETFYFLVEATGYESGFSRGFARNEGEVNYDFKLQKGTGPEGTVFLTDGQPARGAQVILTTPSKQVRLIDGTIQQKENYQYLETDQDGVFRFASQTESYRVMILHEDGFALVSEDELGALPEVTLQPWAKVKGEFFVGKAPGANIRLQMVYDRTVPENAEVVTQQYSTITDNNGNFVFERVPPGPAKIFREIQQRIGSVRLSHDFTIEIEPGQTHDITIGGTGRPVAGQILIPDSLKDSINLRNSDYSLRIDSENNPYTQLNFQVQDDGSFWIDDVPAGDYCLSFSFYSSSTTSSGMELVGSVSHSFTVPEMPDGRSDEILELGVLDVEVFATSSMISSLIGRTLPGFTNIKTDFDPAQSQDKMILVCFWDYEQRPSRNCIQQLNKQAKELKSRDITIVTVHASQIDEEVLNEWIDENNITLPVGLVETDNVRLNWSVRSLPWMILTDKEHIIRKEGFSINELDDLIISFE